jgi:CRISPR-associated protein Cas4
MVNEYSYCPRLFYLEYVQGEWAHSVDTLDGRLIHRRVDQAKGHMPAPEELDDMPKLHARSVMVGSDTLGAVARIDLIEDDDGRVVPVDYKRGAPPDIPEGAYEPERVQVCLQGLLLREHGYACDYGILYFAASQTRVTVEFTDALVARTLELLRAARRTAEAEDIPPPLVDSPKCPRCSLVGICLPDEVNLLRIGGAHPTADSTQDHISSPIVSITGRRAEPRRLVPARDDHIAVYVQGQGYSVGLKGEVLEIREKGKVVREARLMEIAQLSGPCPQYIVELRFRDHFGEVWRVLVH